jgi:hypothetical protein
MTLTPLGYLFFIIVGLWLARWVVGPCVFPILGLGP